MTIISIGNDSPQIDSGAKAANWLIKDFLNFPNYII